MATVTLIATVHRENGMCNATQLAKLLNACRPDVIFEELSELDFDEIYANLRQGSLETEVVKILKQKKELQHYPVDIDGNQIIDKRRKDQFKEMLAVFECNTSYQYLLTELNRGANISGYHYLNSSHCEELFANKYFLEQEVAKKNPSLNLESIHQNWIAIQDIREKKMIHSIYQKFEEINFNTAVFMVGAEHRRPIIDLIKKQKEANSKLQWIFKLPDF